MRIMAKRGWRRGSRCAAREGPSQSSVRPSATVSRQGLASAGGAEGKPGRGRLSGARPRAHDDLDTAETSGAAVIGYIKGKGALHMARAYRGRKGSSPASPSGQGVISCRPPVGMKMRSGLYIRRREEEDARLDQLNLLALTPPTGGPEAGTASAFPNSRFERLAPVLPPAVPEDTYLW